MVQTTIKTAVDTLLTTAVIAPTVYQEPATQALQNITQSHDYTAPLIALGSSIVIQLAIKGFNWLLKKVFGSKAPQADVPTS